MACYRSVTDWLDSLRNAWLSDDPEAISKLFSADSAYHQGPFGVPHRGRHEIEKHWTRTLAQQRKQLIWFGPPVVSGDRAAVEWWCIVRDAQTEKPRTASGCVMLKFDESGHCTSLREYWHGEQRAIYPTFDDLSPSNGSRS